LRRHSARDGGTAACSTSTLAAGIHSIIATYSGDAANAGSSSGAYSQVVNTSTSTPTNALANNVPVTDLSGSAGTELRYTLTVPAGTSTLGFKVSKGTGNANLFVRFGSPPTTTAYDCRSSSPGNTESCGFTFPRSGTYYVMVRGATAFAGVTLTATFK
jgi:serine protease